MIIQTEHSLFALTSLSYIHFENLKLLEGQVGILFIKSKEHIFQYEHSTKPLLWLFKLLNTSFTNSATNHHLTFLKHPSIKSFRLFFASIPKIGILQ